jgi:hypothetical protein
VSINVPFRRASPALQWNQLIAPGTGSTAFAISAANLHISYQRFPVACVTRSPDLRETNERTYSFGFDEREVDSYTGPGFLPGNPKQTRISDVRGENVHVDGGLES